MDKDTKKVEEHLRSLLRVGGLRKGLMVRLGDIPILLGVEAVVVVGYQGIRVCLEQVDRTILGGNGNCLQYQKSGIAI
jgi:hypothetical protein